ncbi:MAG: WD40 repeat domain-containing protein, partial [Bacteroidia bacterium]|nr:WD40 repeat domain-containing protein [Bacteroidia bacterium]
TITDAHNAQINALKYNKQGSLLASASNDLVINVFDSTYKKIKMLVASSGHAANINALTFDNSGKVIFSGDDAGKIIIWSLETQKILRTLQNTVQVNALAMSNDPRTIIVAGQEPTIRVINVANSQTQRSFIGHTDVVNAIEVSPNQKYLLSGSNDKSARIWDIRTGKELKKLPVDCWKVTAVAFSFDSKYCATGCNDGSIKIWEVETGNLIESITAQNFNTRDIVFLKRYNQIAAAPMLRNSSEYGVRVYQTDLMDPITASQVVKVVKSNVILNKFQNELDSIQKERNLTKKDSVRYQIQPYKVFVKSKNLNRTPLDSVRIYKTPSVK